MANTHVAVIVRGKLAGKRVNWSLERAKKEKLTGSFWTKWYSRSATSCGGKRPDKGKAQRYVVHAGPKAFRKEMLFRSTS